MAKKLWKVYKSHAKENLLHTVFRRNITKILKPGDWVEISSQIQYSGSGFSYLHNNFPPSIYGGVMIKGIFVKSFEDCYEGKTKNNKKVLVCSDFGLTVRVYNFATQERELTDKIIKDVHIALNNIIYISKTNLEEPVGLIRDPIGKSLSYVPLTKAQQHGVEVIKREITFTENQLIDLNNKLKNAKESLVDQTDIVIPKLPSKRTRLSAIPPPKSLDYIDD